VPADDADEGLFFQVWQMTWAASLQDGESSIVGDTKPVDAAINAPGGKLTEALLDRLWKRKPAEGLGLPDNLRRFFDTMGAGTSASNRYARVIFASRLVWLHAVDAEWSRDRIIARMRIGQDPEAPALWAGYLWSPRYSLSLLHDLKPVLLEAIARAAHIDEAHRRSLFELFAEIAVANGSVFAESELANAFASLSAEGLAKCASRFERNLEAAGGKAAALWQETIGPIFAKYWPKTRQAVTPATSGSLARMLLATREAFPEALGTVDRHKLLGQTDASLVIHRLTQHAAEQATASDVPDGDAKAPAFYDLVRNHPEDVLRLLRITVDPEGERWQLRDLDKLLSCIAAISPDAVQGDDFKHLRNVLARG
jgi:hypothetical protein